MRRSLLWPTIYVMVFYVSPCWAVSGGPFTTVAGVAAENKKKRLVTADDGARGWASRRRGCWVSPPPPLDPARDSAASDWRARPFGETKSETNERNGFCSGRLVCAMQRSAADYYSGTKPGVGGWAGPRHVNRLFPDTCVAQ